MWFSAGLVWYQGLMNSWFSVVQHSNIVVEHRVCILQCKRARRLAKNMRMVVRFADRLCIHTKHIYMLVLKRLQLCAASQGLLFDYLLRFSLEHEGSYTPNLHAFPSTTELILGELPARLKISAARGFGFAAFHGEQLGVCEIHFPVCPPPDLIPETFNFSPTDCSCTTPNFLFGCHSTLRAGRSWCSVLHASRSVRSPSGMPSW